MRLGQDQYFMNMAKLAGSRTNCYRRAVGCVLVDKNNRVLATGYNGVPRGFPHCEPGHCPRESLGSGTSLHICLAVHAEQNALMFCHDIDKIEKVYVTASPCLTCMVMLLNTPCKEIIFEEFYPSSEQAKQAWIDSGRLWTQISCPKTDV